MPEAVKAKIINIAISFERTVGNQSSSLVFIKIRF